MEPNSQVSDGQSKTRFGILTLRPGAESSLTCLTIVSCFLLALGGFAMLMNGTNHRFAGGLLGMSDSAEARVIVRNFGIISISVSGLALLFSYLYSKRHFRELHETPQIMDGITAGDASIACGTYTVQFASKNPASSDATPIEFIAENNDFQGTCDGGKRIYLGVEIETELWPKGAKFRIRQIKLERDGAVVGVTDRKGSGQFWVVSNGAGLPQPNYYLDGLPKHVMQTLNAIAEGLPPRLKEFLQVQIRVILPRLRVENQNSVVAAGNAVAFGLAGALMNAADDARVSESRKSLENIRRFVTKGDFKSETSGESLTSLCTTQGWELCFFYVGEMEHVDLKKNS
jgi:hypothetical protein